MTATKYYTTNISPPISDGSAPVSSTTYTITSNGYINGVHKKVIAVVKPSGGDIQLGIIFKWSI